MTNFFTGIKIHPKRSAISKHNLQTVNVQRVHSFKSNEIKSIIFSYFVYTSSVVSHVNVFAETRFQLNKSMNVNNVKKVDLLLFVVDRVIGSRAEKKK